MNNRGISEVIVGLFLILLAFVSVAIVSVVISNLIQMESEKISLGNFFIDLDLKSIKIQNDGSVSVNVKRNPGEGDLTGIKFVFSDGKNTKIIEKDASLKELEQSTYTFTAEELSGFQAKDVSIAPVVNGISGESETKNIVETKIVPEISTSGENVIVINFATISEGETQEVIE